MSDPHLPPPPPGPPPAPAPSRSRSGKRVALVTAGAVGTVAVITGGVFAARWYFGSGPQPAEALPASTLGYLSLDLDPGGKELLAARDALDEFPAWEALDVDSSGDVRQQLFDLAQQDLQCDALDYDDDIDSWLGDRVAVAAIPTGEETDDGLPQVDPVFVAQVEDAEAAEDGLAALADCPDFGALGWQIGDEWAVLAETDEIAARVADDAASDPLSDDADFAEHMDAVGGSGILTGYAAPEAGEFLAAALAEEVTDGGALAPPEMTDMTDLVADSFQGAGIAVGFQDEALQIEMATTGDSSLMGLTGDQGEAATVDDIVGGLPDDTAAVYALGFQDGWAGAYLDMMSEMLGDQWSAVDAEIEAFEAELGLDVVDTVEALLGDAAVLAVGGDFDIEEVEAAGPAGTPVGIKVQGDPDEIQETLDQVYDKVPPFVSELLESDTEGDYLVAGPSSDYRETLLEGGDLGSSEKFERVVPDADDATAVVFVDLDATAVDQLGEVLPPEVAENVALLDAFGLSSRVDGDTTVATLRLSVD